MDTLRTALEIPAHRPVVLDDASRDPADAEHYVVCLECGQSFDRRNLAHALYHAEPNHDPFVVEG